jgi:transposase
LCHGEHHAVACYNHTTKSEFFEKWFEERMLKSIPLGEGYTVIMDNASFHRKKALRKLARGKVRLLFLPPYSPDYNSIEKTWANMKRYLRSNLKDFKSLDKAVYNYFGISII